MSWFDIQIDRVDALADDLVTQGGMFSNFAEQVLNVQLNLAVRGIEGNEIKHRLALISSIINEEGKKVVFEGETLVQICSIISSAELNTSQGVSSSKEKDMSVPFGEDDGIPWEWIREKIGGFPLFTIPEKSFLPIPLSQIILTLFPKIERPHIADVIFKIPDKEKHYNRNDNMPLSKLPSTPEEAREWGWDDSVASDCHQFNVTDGKNMKFVSPDGRYEVIFNPDGEVVTDAENQGTYNFADPNSQPMEHFFWDVLPWIVHGNSEQDLTNAPSRLWQFLVIGGLHKIFSN